MGGGVGGPPSPTAPSASSRSWYWPFNSSDGDVPLTSQHAGQADAAGAAGAKVPTVVDAAALDGVATSLQLEQQQQAGGTSSSSKGASKAAAAAASGGSSSGRGVSDAEATLIESARAALWRDAAPVTAASAKAAADDLRAAANAMLTAWLGAAGSLNLPSDLMPGMFAPAVVEAYPAAARVVDFSVAQQRTCAVLEVRESIGCCCVLVTCCCVVVDVVWCAVLCVAHRCSCCKRSDSKLHEVQLASMHSLLSVSSPQH